jgi:lipoprotein-anchoring transpeptidase ErfK/SrfK
MNSILTKPRIFITAGIVLLLAALITSSLIFTAPGTTINSMNVGLATANHAVSQVETELAEHTVTINDQEFTLEELSITYDQDALNETINNHKAWKVNSWGEETTVPLTVDETQLKETLQTRLPDSYKEPVNADTIFNGSTWVVTPAENGKTLNIEELLNSIQTNLTENQNNTSYSLEETAPTVITETAEQFTAKLNENSTNAGFYLNDQNTVQLSSAEYAELFTVERTEEGFQVTPNETNINTLVDGLAGKVNREPKNGVAVTNENGERIHTLEDWQDGFKLTGEQGLKEQVKNKIRNMEPARFTLTGETTPAQVKELFRRVEVDLAARKVYTYENEELVKEYAVAIGRPGHETDPGHFHVRAQVTIQDMGCVPGYDYCTEDVKWVTYYNGDEAFHGTYWHNDFGNPQASARSHGCVNMTEDDAYEMYKFAQIGTPVWVH